MKLRLLNSAKAFLDRPGNEFIFIILFVPLPMIIFAEPSKWIAIAALAYTALITRIYGSSQFLDGFVAGKEAEQQRMREASGCEPAPQPIE